MDITCNYARLDPDGKIKCSKQGVLCGHVYFCHMAGRYKQTRQADKCPIRFLLEDEKPKKRGKKK